MPEPLYYSVLAGALDTHAPPGTLGPQGPGLYRDMLNFIVRDGIMQRRPSVVASGFFTQPDPTGLSSFNPGEIPVWIWTGISPSSASASIVSGGACDDSYFLPGGAKVAIVVTSRQLYVTVDGGATWIIVVPTYTLGTVTATNGSKTVTGAGTAWVTRNITAYQWIQIDGDWYEICEVVSNTEIHLTNNFTGATAGGKAYTIRRTWYGGPNLERTNLIFCTLTGATTGTTENLYLAGTFLGGANGFNTPAVIKIEDIFGASPAAVYLTSSVDLTGSLDAIDVAGEAGPLVDIAGLDVLQIGSVVFTGNGNVFYYSSNVDDAVWTTSPGGFEPVYQLPGAIQAQGRLGTDLTFHFQGGVVRGVPVADNEPPIALQKTGAAIGAYCPRTLREFGGTERFVAHDGSVYAFDGAQCYPVGDPVDEVFKALNVVTVRSEVHAAIDVQQGEYWLFRDQQDGSTLALCHQVREDRWTKHQFAFPIGAVSDRHDLASTYAAAQMVVGISNYDAVEAGFPRATFLYGFSQGSSTDTPAPFTGVTHGGHYLELDDLMLAAPGFMASIQRIILFCRGLSGTPETLALKISRNGGSTWERTDSRSVTLATTGEKLTQFSFAEMSAPLLRVRLEKDSASATLSVMPTRLLIVHEPGAEVATVGF